MDQKSIFIRELIERGKREYQDYDNPDFDKHRRGRALSAAIWLEEILIDYLERSSHESRTDTL